MNRNIQSIRVLVNKYSTTVYVNFFGNSYGVHSKDAGASRWIDSGLNAEELAQAKKLALVNGKWTNWTAKASSSSKSSKSSEPETLENMPILTNDEKELIRRNNLARSEPERYG